MCKGKEEEEEEERNSKSNVTVDRISDLPDAVIHHILSLVPTVDVVRMSVLSRRWRRMWYSVPTLQFSDSVGFKKRESFNVFVDECLMHRSQAMRYIADSDVIRLKLDISYTRDNDRLAMNRWSKSPLIRNCVKELDICGRAKPSLFNGYYDFMPSVALNGRSLRIIKLEGLKLDGSCSVNLPSLKSLYLDNVPFGEGVNHTLRNLMIGCPSLENLALTGYRYRYSKIKISSSSLKYLELKIHCKLVNVIASNLQSLVVDCRGDPHIGFSSCTTIRDLSLTDYNGYDQISKLTCLENLTLSMSEGFGHINVVSPTLKRFSLKKLNDEEAEVTTEMPNLVSFNYEGHIEFSITMKTPNPQLEGSFSFGRRYSGIPDEDWYPKLMTFFSNINCLWNSLSLRSNEDEDLIIPEKLRKTCRPPWPTLSHLKVTMLSMTRESELRKVLKWLAPSLVTLSTEREQAEAHHS